MRGNRSKSPKKQFLLITKDPELKEIVKKHSNVAFTEEEMKLNSDKEIDPKHLSAQNAPVKLLKRPTRNPGQEDCYQPPQKKQSNHKFFNESPGKKNRRVMKKKLSVENFRPVTPDYQAFEAPKCSNKSKYPRLELFFHSINMPSKHRYFLHVIKKEDDFKFKTDYSNEATHMFKQTLKTKFIFEKKQIIQVNIWSEFDVLLGGIEFELGQLVGNPKNCLILDLVGGRHGVKLIKGIFDSGFHSSTKDLEKMRKRPKLKIMFESLKPSMHELEQQKYDKKFLDFLRGNLKMQVIACVDFTASNIHTSEPLHAIYEDKLNEYQSAIASVCSILLNYDFDKEIPIYGFGAVIQEEGFDNIKPEDTFARSNLRRKSVASNMTYASRRSKRRRKKRQDSVKDNFGPVVEIVEKKVEKRASHFFPLSGKWENTSGNGIEGVFEIYTNLVNSNKIRMSGPTLFAPMLDNINKMAYENMKKDPYCYSILLIMTDGVIHDMEETIEKVIDGAYLPLSIIIVGLGCEDFTYMEILDSDNYALRDQNGRVNERDIIQFVDYSIFNMKDKRFEGLAEEVLQEIPRQVCTFYESKGIEPKEPENTLDNELMAMMMDACNEEGGGKRKDDLLDIEIKELSEEDLTSKMYNAKDLGFLKDSAYLGSNPIKKYEYKKIITSSFKGGSSQRSKKYNYEFKMSLGSNSMVSVSSTNSNWKYMVPDEGSSHRDHIGNIREFKAKSLISSLKNIYRKKDGEEKR